MASWYGPGFAGLTTASGEPFDPSDYTAASKTLPFGTKLIVTYNDKSVVVRINDRGPYVAGRDLDLSQAAAEYIGLTAVGSASVDVAYADASTPTGPYTSKVSSATAPGGSTANDNPAPATRPATSPETASSQQQPARDQYATPPVAQTAPTPAQDQYAPPPPPPSPNVHETPPPDLVKPDSTVKQRIVERLAAPPKGFEGLAGKTAPPPAPTPQATTRKVEQKNVPQVAATQRELTVPQVAGTTAQVEQVKKKQPATTVENVTSSEQGVTHQEKKGKTIGGAPGITVLPDTGGAPLGGLVGGGVLLVCGAALIHRLRS